MRGIGESLSGLGAFGTRQTSPTVTAGDATVTADGTATLPLTLSAAPDGLAGYALRARVGDPSVARIVGATAADLPLTDSRVAGDGGRARVGGVDLDDSVTSGATDVALGRLTVEGRASGATPVAVDVLGMDDDAGGRVGPATAAGTVTVDGGTPTPTPTVGTGGYDLRSGDLRELRLDGQRYYAIRKVPGTDASRWAVTTDDYRLVDVETARHVLWANRYAGKTDHRPFYRDDLEYSKRRRGELEMREFAARAGEIGLNVLEGWALLTLGAGVLVVGTVVDTLTDLVAWGQDELTNPYREALTATAATGRNLDWIDTEVTALPRDQWLTADMERVVDTAAGFAGVVDDFQSVGQAFRTYMRGRAVSNPSASGMFYLGVKNQAVNFLKGFAKGIVLAFAVDATVDAAEGWFRRNAKIASILHAYHSLRIPILEELIEMETRAQAGRLAPADVVRYHLYKLSMHQIRALAFDMTSMHYQQMADDGGIDLGEVMEVIQGVEDKAEEHDRRAARSADAAKYALLGLGVGRSEADAETRRSINREVASGGGQ